MGAAVYVRLHAYESMVEGGRWMKTQTFSTVTSRKAEARSFPSDCGMGRICLEGQTYGVWGTQES